MTSIIHSKNIEICIKQFDSRRRSDHKLSTVTSSSRYQLSDRVTLQGKQGYEMISTYVNQTSPIDHVINDFSSHNSVFLLTMGAAILSLVLITNHRKALWEILASGVMCTAPQKVNKRVFPWILWHQKHKIIDVYQHLPALHTTLRKSDP